MRILLLTFEFPPALGGTGTYSYHMARELTKRGHEVHVLAHSPGVTRQEALNFDQDLEFTVRRFPSSPSKLMRIWHRTRVSFQEFRRSAFDVIFVPFPNAAVLAWAFDTIWGAPYVVTGHGSEFSDPSRFRRVCLKTAFNSARAVLVNSEFTRGLMEVAGFSTRRVHVTPFGADPTLYDPGRPAADLRESRGWGSRPVVLTVGSLRALKGHEVVLEAMARLLKDIPDLLYLIVGEGEQRPELERRIRDLGLEEAVVFEGLISREALRDYYRACDVFCLNSSFESFGIVLVEAALMGKPAVATRVGGVPEVLSHGETGLLVPPGSPKETAGALRRLFLNPEERQGMGKAARERALSRFTWGRTGEQTEELLREAVRSGA